MLSFPVVHAEWHRATEAIRSQQPAVVIAVGGDVAALSTLSADIAVRTPLVPLIVLNPHVPLPHTALPFSFNARTAGNLAGRITAALRIRSLHATVLRRTKDSAASTVRLPDADPLNDATVLLIGRGKSYPAFSVALGLEMAVVGALSIEAAAKHLSNRDIDGIVIGEGFSSRVVNAFLMVLSEDSRFRNLPIMVAGAAEITSHDLPFLEVMSGDPYKIVADSIPLIRLHAFEAALHRTLKSIDAGGLTDPRTGLLTRSAFDRDLPAAIRDALVHGTQLSIARFKFATGHERARLDGSRILTRLMRRMDFATLYDDNSILVVFADADLRTAQTISRRLASVMKHTILGVRPQQRIDAKVSLASIVPGDNAATLLARLEQDLYRAVS